jgi:DNA-binding HxlR family transcriptional regulator
MNEERLTKALSLSLGPPLASDLVRDFLKTRMDLMTKTLERASPGKFVETFVQCLQQMATGKYDAKPVVDDYLDKRVENEISLPEGLRICAARVARSIYTFRNKRNIAHKNEVDPNAYDLAFVYNAAAWIMAELIRNASGVTMSEAGELVALVQVPVSDLVEDIDGIRLVHADVSVKSEILILLHSRYPQRASFKEIETSMKARSKGSIQNRLGEMVYDKLVHGGPREGYRLTQAGYAAAISEIRALAAA